MIEEYLLGKITLDELYESFNELITKKIIKGLKGEDMWNIEDLRKEEVDLDFE